jgi:hypothetical protein
MIKTKTDLKIISMQVAKSQLRDIDKIIKLYPHLFANRSHFYRASANYFLRHINSGEFKVSY